MTARGHVTSPVTSKNNNSLLNLFAYMIQQNYSALTRLAPEIAAPLWSRVRHREGAWENSASVRLRFVQMLIGLQRVNRV